MIIDRDIHQVLRYFDGKVENIEQRHIDPSVLQKYDTAIDQNYAVISIPIDKLKELSRMVIRKNHPTDIDIKLIYAKRELYETNSYFKMLYDRMNTYLQMKID
jgi:hypothetical protein